ncbi:MAG: two-component system, OmpR family, phosphate regulon response regulator PhoB [Verrucomicrobiota bacterium]|jgi:two-component system phosphate regulon response regulator PhoB|nr:two-component system, OmpR family, phosphate regulon response regulator PhoB [Verrucomicrobiota bacterium]MDK2962809.1 two-component system, OmpR family, phosphate regulon response regulator PhoB [Verrucomicrobiota bacterium]
MAKKQILVIEDEEDIRELVRYNLEREGFGVLEAESGEDGLNAAAQNKPDLILLDLMLPGKDGLQVCRELKRSDDLQEIPLIMMTAKGEESDIVTGLELGAEDYIVKPFSPKVLVARVKAVLRRKTAAAAPDAGDVLSIHGITIHPGRHEVTVGGKSIDLTATEFGILHFLARRPGWVFTRYQIVDAVHGEDYPVTERSIDVQIVGLRKKLKKTGDYIETVRGIGYRIKDRE